jgi:hypothetical protein
MGLTATSEAANIDERRAREASPRKENHHKQERGSDEADFRTHLVAFTAL